MTRKLYPPLARIRSELLDAPDRRPASADFFETDDDPRWTALASEPLPDFITDLIQRQAAASQSHATEAPAPPAVGQIRCLASIPEGRSLGRNVGILLGAHLEDKRWSGWLVVQEVDYATDRDLVIEADDGSIDPLAGMVQTWNPVRIPIDGQERILGKLAPLRLAAVIALADAPQVGGGAKPKPGKVYGWDLDAGAGIVVATGTPLGDADDPRHEYRALYRQLAAEINAAASAVVPSATPPSQQTGWLVSTFVHPAWTFGAMAAATLLALHALLDGAPRTENLGYNGQAPGMQPVAPSTGQVLRVTLAAKGDLGTLRDLLRLPGVALRHLEFDNDTLSVWLHVASPEDDIAAQAAKLPGVTAVQVVPQ